MVTILIVRSQGVSRRLATSGLGWLLTVIRERTVLIHMKIDQTAAGEASRCG